ncbi:DNA-directed RNA polymerase subunit beta [Paulownia witches'-broom phytoplasma]|uniref:DNA-directed RNA polymerase subunit beta n=4 Tax=Paulownia witches'-broom phytoplasma TaxID=39647 RepID=A0ABX8TRD3_9MOLU|nr:DNA-directed RNA polymerase subunit beta [Paulownia witches'-broom phytoplasma]QYC31070.1 DNA-directed RNA polymerase subunit beta [Paulownia witches'-broom phytoplasma]GLH60272.1 DNA-directed RNA polymerase subunit beta [Paulownia witches'-broom phytoplasma]
MGYHNVKYGKKAQRRNYSKTIYDVDLPNLIEIQNQSFDWFLKHGIKELLQDFCPIESYNGDLKIHFDDYFLAPPKYSIEETKIKDISYVAQLFVKTTLENVLTGETKQSNILLTELPLMTPTGNFVINGTERVVVSQIVRSASVYFAGNFDSKLNRTTYSGQVIPSRGAWIEYEEGSKEILYAKLDRSKKIPLSNFIYALGFDSKEAIENVFGKSAILDSVFDKETDMDSDNALVELYSKIRQGEKVPVDTARDFIRTRLFDQKKYDLAKVGRYKFNKKLDVLTRAENTYLACDFVNPETQEIIIAQDELLTKEKIAILKQNRHFLLQEIFDAKHNLENETDEEILAYKKDPQKNELFTKTNIINSRTGEVLVAKDTLVNDDIINHLRHNIHTLDEKVSKFFLGTKDIYQKEADRQGVFNEILEVYTSKDESGKLYHKVKLIGNDQRETKKHITLSDVIASINYYLNLYENVGTVDDIDHLGNRRLRLIGELLKNQFRIGLTRAEKNIKDMISTSKFSEVNGPGDLVNFTFLMSVIKTFFTSSRLSQFMDQINPLAELTQKRRVSALGIGGINRDRAGIEVRDVHNSHYGRLCPIETPEGPSIGLITSLSTYAKVNKYGFIQTPFFKVLHQDGKTILSRHIDYLTADQEKEEIIASSGFVLDANNAFKDKKIIARRNGETGIFERSQITYADVSPKQIVSVATSSIPFLEHNDASRALMGANMQRQAVPLLIPESPIVGTGVEYRAAKDSGCLIIARESGFVTYVDAQKIIITKKPNQNVLLNGKTLYDTTQEFTYAQAKALYENNYKEHQAKYTLINFAKSNQDTLVLQKPIVVLGEQINEGDILVSGPSTSQGELALGRNVTVAFMTWEGYNYEDAIIMSEELVKRDVYTSIHIDKYEVQTRELKKGSGQEEITREVPNVGADAIKNLDERGIIIPGSEVKEGDILVGKITPQGNIEPSPSEKLIQIVIGEKAREYKDSSLRVPFGEGGIVQSVHYFSRKNGDVLPAGVNENIRVFIAKKRKINEGDKMAGRHGNKGVISRILPKEDLPYMADGTPIDIMLNPLGVPSRMNIGQILEIHLGMAAKKLGIKVATPVFDGVNDYDLKEIMKEANLDPDGKMVLYDGRTGEPYDSRISVGVMYMVKLSHMVDDKLHARNVGPYTLVTQQPMGGKVQNGGQRFGEMEVWALYAYGAAHTLQEILTVKSDDIVGRNKTYSAIVQGTPLPKPSIPESFRVFIKELQSLGLYVELIKTDTKENEVNKSLIDYKKEGYN